MLKYWKGAREVAVALACRALEGPAILTPLILRSFFRKAEEASRRARDPERSIFMQANASAPSPFDTPCFARLLRMRELGRRTRSASVRATIAAALLALTLGAIAPAAAQSGPPPFAPAFGPNANELPVRVENHSGPELCAEKDNVELNFVSPLVRRFEIQAVHPSYIGMIGNDRWAPDWTSCDMTHDSHFPADARRVTFWETPEFWLTGYTFPSFWRPGNVPVRVGDRVERGLHLVQLWMLYRERAEEILVFYPPDGYWRARPLPYGDMRWTAYGSSFLLGPMEVDERPMVKLKEVSFDPATKSFHLDFVRGGSATLSLRKIDRDHVSLEAKLDGPMPDNRPFLTLRSMYTTESNADVGAVSWRTKDGKGWGEAPVMTFPGAEVTEIWAGRRLPSRHNLSAPDMVVSHFEK